MNLQVFLIFLLLVGLVGIVLAITDWSLLGTALLALAGLVFFTFIWKAEI
jgi:hypothetical protein